MGANTKAIKNRIRSVKNTKKITKAMELVSASKMRKAIEASTSSRTYAEHAWNLLTNLANEKNLEHPLLNKPDSDKILLIAVASNRGLCGGYNVNLIKTVCEFIAQQKNKQIELIIVGRRGEIIAKRTQSKVLASFIEFGDNLQSEEIGGLTNLVLSEFSQGKYAQVLLAYTDFISSIQYEPKIKPILPISKENVANLLAEQKKDEREVGGARALLTFEPTQERVLELVLPRLTEVQIYQAILEANASEHSARMLAMKNASDSASEIVQDLTMSYNRARQASITQEISEISGGAEALANQS
ncbi:MAG: ATP synthase F1 subunit gamma [Patescibacteria group bacterium]